MSIHRLTSITALLVLAACGCSQAVPTLTGTVTDTMCGAKHMMTNVPAAQCTRECVKEGSDFGLLSNGKVYTLKGDVRQLDKYAGKVVRVTGDLSGTAITVHTISVIGT